MERKYRLGTYVDTYQPTYPTITACPRTVLGTSCFWHLGYLALTNANCRLLDPGCNFTWLYYAGTLINYLAGDCNEVTYEVGSIMVTQNSVRLIITIQRSQVDCSLWVGFVELLSKYVTLKD